MYWSIYPFKFLSKGGERLTPPPCNRLWVWSVPSYISGCSCCYCFAVDYYKPSADDAVADGNDAADVAVAAAVVAAVAVAVVAVVVAVVAVVVAK